MLPRIIAVADTFDALTTNRPYQQAHDPEAALRIIHNLSGKRLDPTAVAALTAIYERGEIRIQQPNVPVASVRRILQLRPNFGHAVICSRSAGRRGCGGSLGTIASDVRSQRLLTAKAAKIPQRAQRANRLALCVLCGILCAFAVKIFHDDTPPPAIIDSAFQVSEIS